MQLKIHRFIFFTKQLNTEVDQRNNTSLITRSSLFFLCINDISYDLLLKKLEKNKNWYPTALLQYCHVCPPGLRIKS